MLSLEMLLLLLCQNLLIFLRDELFVAKRQDPLWSAVVYALESGDEPVLSNLHAPLSQFSLVDCTLCRIGLFMSKQ